MYFHCQGQCCARMVQLIDVLDLFNEGYQLWAGPIVLLSICRMKGIG